MPLSLLFRLVLKFNGRWLVRTNEHVRLPTTTLSTFPTALRLLIPRRHGDRGDHWAGDCTWPSQPTSQSLMTSCQLLQICYARLVMSHTQSEPLSTFPGSFSWINGVSYQIICGKLFRRFPLLLDIARLIDERTHLSVSGALLRPKIFHSHFEDPELSHFP